MSDKGFICYLKKYIFFFGHGKKWWRAIYKTNDFKQKFKSLTSKNYIFYSNPCVNSSWILFYILIVSIPQNSPLKYFVCILVQFLSNWDLRETWWACVCVRETEIKIWFLISKDTNIATNKCFCYSTLYRSPSGHLQTRDSNGCRERKREKDTGGSKNI